MINIQIPYNFTPRPYQARLFNCLADGYKRAIAIWHRRAGKDKVIFNLLVKEAMKRKGIYYYIFPTYNQGRKVLWDGIDKAGFKFLDHIPVEIRAATNSTEMKITLINGSIIQVVGSDNIDSVMGTNPIGCVYSEFSLQNPRGWDFVRPILSENGGWAIFNTTPRGKNHAYNLYRMAQLHPDEWFSECLTVMDTHAITLEAIEAERRSGMDEDTIQQEYYCSFDAATPGAYYAKQIKLAYDENRITNVPANDHALVHTAWDIGFNDTTAIGFFQVVGQEYHFIDHYEMSGEGLAHYAKVLRDRGYLYGTYIGPHDIEQHDISTGKSRKEIAADLGIHFEVAPKLLVDDGINAVRAIFGRCWFDHVKCARLIEALASYHKDFDEKNRVYRMRPVHDWSSNSADMFRYFAVAYDMIVNKVVVDRQMSYLDHIVNARAIDGI